VEQKSALAVFSKFLTAAREILPFIETQQVQILLEIARKLLSTMKEPADDTDSELQHIKGPSALGEEHWKGKPGLGLGLKLGSRRASPNGSMADS
jgi:hypothetical protein